MTDVPDLDVSYLTIMWKDDSVEVQGNTNTAESIGLMVMAFLALVRGVDDGP